jgi:hypothetical protein
VPSHTVWHTGKCNSLHSNAKMLLTYSLRDYKMVSRGNWRKYGTSRKLTAVDGNIIGCNHLRSRKDMQGFFIASHVTQHMWVV